MKQTRAISAVKPTKWSQLFAFSGQSELPPWRLREVLRQRGWSEYEAWIRHGKHLCFQTLRKLVDEFPTKQRRKQCGRPPCDERDLIAAFILRQILGIPFTRLPEAMQDFQEALRFRRVHERSTLTQQNRSRRMQRLLRRFFDFIVEKLGCLRSILITDATGFGNYARTWRDASYPDRAKNNWIKAHCVLERETGLFVRIELTRGRVHDGQAFPARWAGIPSCITPRRSIADAAYFGNDCLMAAGATPIHDIKANARHVKFPKTEYQKLVNFATHWPNRYWDLKGPRKEIEGAFGQTKQAYGHRLNCHKKRARENEIMAKFLAHNIRSLAFTEHVTS